MTELLLAMAGKAVTCDPSLANPSLTIAGPTARNGLAWSWVRDPSGR